jgi:hypothetical protein
MYGGEGCRGKRKVVCYPAGGGRASGGVAPARRPRPTTRGWVGGKEISTTARSWPADPLPALPPPPPSNRCSTTFLPRWPAQGPPSHIFEPAANAPLQLLFNYWPRRRFGAGTLVIGPLWAQQRTAMGGGGILCRKEGLADVPVIYSRFLRHNIDTEKDNRVSL